MTLKHTLYVWLAVSFLKGAFVGELRMLGQLAFKWKPNTKKRKKDKRRPGIDNEAKKAFSCNLKGVAKIFLGLRFQNPVLSFTFEHESRYR